MPNRHIVHAVVLRKPGALPKSCAHGLKLSPHLNSVNPRAKSIPVAQAGIVNLATVDINNAGFLHGPVSVPL